MYKKERIKKGRKGKVAADIDALKEKRAQHEAQVMELGKILDMRELQFEEMLQGARAMI